MKERTLALTNPQIVTPVRIDSGFSVSLAERDFVYESPKN